jgi:hypothetical protein
MKDWLTAGMEQVARVVNRSPRDPITEDLAGVAGYVLAGEAAAENGLTCSSVMARAHGGSREEREDAGRRPEAWCLEFGSGDVTLQVYCSPAGRLPVMGGMGTSPQAGEIVVDGSSVPCLMWGDEVNWTALTEVGDLVIVLRSGGLPRKLAELRHEADIAAYIRAHPDRTSPEAGQLDGPAS